MKSCHPSVSLFFPFVLFSCCGEPSKGAEHSQSTALLLLIDSSTFASKRGIEIVREACSTAAKTLSSQDLMAVVGFGSNPTLILSFTGARREEDLSQHVLRMQADGGKGLHAALTEALRVFESDPHALSCATKHVILISDGDAPDGTYETAVRAVVEKGITMSTVCFSSSTFDPVLMNQIADWGKGRFYFTERFTNVPGLVGLATHEVAVSAPKGN